jgi:hypothetical protein
MRPPIRKGTSVASSVYDADEFQPTTRLTLKQAITLITLRLGKLEVFANEMKLTGSVSREGDVGGLDKDFLLSIVSRLDNMEKMQHNIRIEIENIKNSMSDVQSFVESDVVIDLNDQPIIIDILNRLNTIDESMKDPEPDVEIVEIVENVENENVVTENFPVYNPDVIEPYIEPEVEVPLSQPTPQPLQPTPQPLQPPLQPQFTQEKEQNPKTPRKRGKKITII